MEGNNTLFKTIEDDFYFCQGCSREIVEDVELEVQRSQRFLQSAAMSKEIDGQLYLSVGSNLWTKNNNVDASSRKIPQEKEVRDHFSNMNVESLQKGEELQVDKQVQAGVYKFFVPGEKTKKTSYTVPPVKDLGTSNRKPVVSTAPNSHRRPKIKAVNKQGQKISLFDKQRNQSLFRLNSQAIREKKVKVLLPRYSLDVSKALDKVEEDNGIENLIDTFQKETSELSQTRFSHLWVKQARVHAGSYLESARKTYHMEKLKFLWRAFVKEGTVEGSRGKKYKKNHISLHVKAGSNGEAVYTVPTQSKKKAEQFAECPDQVPNFMELSIKHEKVKQMFSKLKIDRWSSQNLIEPNFELVNYPNQEKFLSAVDGDLHRPTCQFNPPADNEGIIQEVEMKLEGYNSPSTPFVQPPFSLTSLGSNPCNVQFHITVKPPYVPRKFVVKHTVNMNYLRFETSKLVKLTVTEAVDEAAQQEDAKLKGNTKAPSRVFGSKRRRNGTLSNQKRKKKLTRDIFLLVGSQQVARTSDLVKPSRALRLMRSDQKYIKSNMHSRLESLLRIFLDNKAMSAFLGRHKRNYQERKIALGSLISVLMVEQLVNADQFESYFKDAVRRLRYVEFNPETAQVFKQVMGGMEGTDESIGDRIERLGVDPFSYSKPALRPNGTDIEEIDYFISHCWADSSEEKLNRLKAHSEAFFRKHNRYPKVWFDVFCIDQNESEVEKDVKLLPVFLMACRQMLVYMSPIFLTRLWCVTELYSRKVMSSYQVNDAEILVYELPPTNTQVYQKTFDAEFDQAASRYTTAVLKYVSRPYSTVPQTLADGAIDTPANRYTIDLTPALIKNARCQKLADEEALKKKLKLFPGQWHGSAQVIKHALWDASWHDVNGIPYKRTADAEFQV